MARSARCVSGSVGRSTLLFDGVDAATLESLGEVRTPGITDLFVALLGSPLQSGLEGKQ